jgi:hypothetical protein
LMRERDSDEIRPVDVPGQRINHHPGNRGIEERSRAQQQSAMLPLPASVGSCGCSHREV